MKLASPQHALLCVPSGYVDLRHIRKVLPQMNDDEAALYKLTFSGMRGFAAPQERIVDGVKRKRARELDLGILSNWRAVQRLELHLEDDRGEQVVWSVFGNPWPHRDRQPGETMYLVGRLERNGIRTSLERVVTPPVHAIGNVWVQYTGIPGSVAGEAVESLVRAQVDDPAAYMVCAAMLTGEIGARACEALVVAGVDDVFSSYEDVIKGLHSPADPETAWLALATAHKLAAMSVQASALRHNIRQPHPKAPLAVCAADIEFLASTQPESLTSDQRNAALAIAERLTDPRPLNALLTGDVGTGKTLPFLLAATAAHRAGAQVTIMSPTTILADQIAEEVVRRFGGNIRACQRVHAGDKIKDHGAILVGTAGLVGVAAKQNYVPNLFIVDEQHKLSAADKAKMLKPWTHLIEATATPVPQALMSVMGGGKDVFNLRQCPVEKSFECLLGDLEDRRMFARRLKDVLDAGQRAAVIYPRVLAQKKSSKARASAEGDILPSRKDDLPVERESAETVASLMEGAAALEAAFPGKVCVVHGGMSPSEIAHAIAMVKSGERPLLVASTVIECGINIPSMGAMIVRDADCFGVAQLHQLRGRLVRNGGQGVFMMMVKDLKTLAQDTLDRLMAVRNTTDGFELAERDMEIRGFGDFAAETQSGKAETVFRLLNMQPRDYLEQKVARDEAIRMSRLHAGLAPIDEVEEPESQAAGESARQRGLF